MLRYLKLLLIIPILAFWYFTTFLYGKGAYEYVQAERMFSQGNVDGFIQYLQSSYPLKSELRMSLGRYVLDILRNNPELREDQGLQALFLFALSELEKEEQLFPRNLYARILLVQYYALIGNKDGMVRALNAALLLSPQRETVLDLKKSVLIFLNGKQ